MYIGEQIIHFILFYFSKYILNYLNHMYKCHNNF